MAATGSLWHALGICPGEVVVFTGSESRTSLAVQVARELTAAGRPPVFTCTVGTAPVPWMTQLCLENLGANWLYDVAEELAAGRPVCLGSRRDAATGKVAPLSPNQVAALKQVKGCVVLVEAGGNSGRPPAVGRQTIPHAANLLVPVVGGPGTAQTVVGAQAAEEGRNHASPDSAPASVEGCLRAAPPGARVVPVLATSDPGGAEPSLREAAARMLGREAANGSPVGRVVLVTPEGPDPVPTVIGDAVAIVLAGGASLRFGGNKLLHAWGDGTVLETSLQAPLKAGLKEVVVVTGAYHEVLAPLLARYPVRVVPNPEWPEGMSTSVRAGLRSFDEEPAAVVVCLGDMPFLPPAVVAELVRAHRRTHAPIVAPVVGGARRNPVLFDRALFPQLMAVRGDEGGRAVVQRYQQEMVRVPFPEEGWFRDVDDPGDLSE